MKHATLNLAVLTLGLMTVLSACARTPQAAGGATAVSTAAAGATSVAMAANGPDDGVSKATPPLPPMLVHKSASCGCCGLWVEHMQAAGFEVEVRNADNVNPIKERVGVPLGKGSCHTAEVGGYFVEGHVPADDVKRLLAERPDAKGLVVPGMPAGSPGMELPDGRTQPYTVELVHADGTTSAFARHQQEADPARARNGHDGHDGHDGH